MAGDITFSEPFMDTENFPADMTGGEAVNVSPPHPYIPNSSIREPPRLTNHDVPSSRQASLPRRRSWYSRNRGRNKAKPINIPSKFVPSSGVRETSMDPMQRWRDSPPEDEPASLSAIHDALQNMPARPKSGQEVDSLRSLRRGASTTSFDSIGSNSSTSASSVISAASSQGGAAISSRPNGRVSKNRKAVDRAKETRPFHCTFCCDRFKTKYDWARHEKSLHLSLETWICAPYGGTYLSSTTEMAQCVYCDLLDPSSEHLDTHHHTTCQNNVPESRVFRRKDNLLQHLRHVHGVDSASTIESWKTQAASISSRCGICDVTMSTWKERQDHLAGHFRKGLTMADWKGDHGFEPSVATRVTNNLPPYLIGSESQSLVPFSATSQGTRDHFVQIQQRADTVDTQAERKATPTIRKRTASRGPVLQGLPEQLSTQTFAQILTRHLGRYAQQQMSRGIIPTDEMFQEESRRLLYDSEDAWNQTIADNPQWLGSFKSSHNVLDNTQPQQLGDNG
ncbi:Fc.00g068470.m01.CDS01 [Cosmosporella sp. VM-42]